MNKNLNFFKSLNLIQIFLGVLVLSVILGIIAGYLLSRNGSNSSLVATSTSSSTNSIPKSPQQDTQTFRDFAEGVIEPMPTPKNPDTYVEGTHLLIRTGAVPVALTSSVVDLNQYNGKKVKVYGQTQKALKVGWLMDVGKVEVEQ